MGVPVCSLSLSVDRVVNTFMERRAKLSYRYHVMIDMRQAWSASLKIVSVQEEDWSHSSPRYSV